MTYQNPLADCIASTYAELRSLDPRNCQATKVLGYSSEFDGGGGTFIRLVNSPSQTDDDATIIVSTFNPFYYWRKWL